MTPTDAVSSASTKFVAIEGNIQKAINGLNKLPADFKSVHTGGPLDLPDGVKQFGYLEMSMYGAEAQELAGEAAHLLRRIVDFHQRCTARAIELGIDGGITTMGGGGR